jgi:hypothetical protein
VREEGEGKKYVVVSPRGQIVTETKSKEPCESPRKREEKRRIDWSRLPASTQGIKVYRGIMGI